MNKNNFAKINTTPVNSFEFFDFCYGKLCDLLQKKGLNFYSNNIVNYVFYDEEMKSIKVDPELIVSLGGDPTYPPGWKNLYRKWKYM